MMLEFGELFIRLHIWNNVTERYPKPQRALKTENPTRYYPMHAYRIYYKRDLNKKEAPTMSTPTHKRGSTSHITKRVTLYLQIRTPTYSRSRIP